MAEPVAALVVLAGAMIALEHLARSGWVRSSAENTGLPAVVVSAYVVLSLLALYVLLRLCARFLAWHSRHRFLEIGTSLIGTGVYGTYVLLEPVPDVDRTSIATLFLLPGYSGGVVIVGLAVVAMVLWVSHAFTGHRPSARRIVAFAVVVFLVVASSSVLDTLTLPQVAAPVVLASGLLWFAARIDFRMFVVVAGSVGGGALVGGLIRIPFGSSLDGDGPGSNPRRIPGSLLMLERTAADTLATPSGGLKMVLLITIVAMAVAILLYGLFAQSRPRLRNRLAASEFFVAGFVSISTGGLLVGTALTGTSTTRYLEPLFLFPLLAVVGAGIHVMRRMLLAVENPALRGDLARASTVFGAAVGLVIVIVGVSGLPTVFALLGGG